MRKLTFTIAAASLALLFAAPAMAQSTGTGDARMKNQPSSVGVASQESPRMGRSMRMKRMHGMRHRHGMMHRHGMRHRMMHRRHRMM